MLKNSAMSDKQLVGKTSESVNESGIYTPRCCVVEKSFQKGNTFQRCPRCERLTKWELVMPQKRAA